LRDDFHHHVFVTRDRSIHIADADRATCETLSARLRREGFLTSFSLETEGLFAALARTRPDVVIANLRLGPADGLATLRRIRALQRGMAIFIIAERPQVEDAITAIKAGAAEVFTKPLDFEQLLGAVREVLRHDVHLPAIRSGTSLAAGGFAQLTPRERQVLQLIADGQSNKQAGRQLGISPRTVEVHRARVMEKLGARNTADLMRIVLTG
jgi:two-component system response regulator FixJ